MNTFSVGWQLQPGSIKVKCAYSCKDGSLLGLDSAGLIVRRRFIDAEWESIPNTTRNYNWISPLRDGGILGVGTDGKLHLLSSPSDNGWSPECNVLVKAAAQLSNSSYIGVSMDGQLVIRAFVVNEWVTVPNSGSVINLSVLSDDSIVGIGTDHLPYLWAPLSGGWSKIPNTTPMLSMFETSQNTTAHISLDGLLYHAPRWSKVPLENPGYTPMALGYDYRYIVDAVPAFYMYDIGEQRASDNALGSALGTSSSAYLPARMYKQNWISSSSNLGFASQEQYVAYWKAIMTWLCRGTAYTPSCDPVTHLHGGCFQAIDGFAAYFTSNPPDLSMRHLRVFAASPFYKGPGRYTLLCGNMQTVTFIIKRDPLAGKTYKIVNRASGQVLTLKDNGTATGTAVVQAPDTGGLGQRWFARLNIGSGLSLVSALCDKVLEFPGGAGAAPGTSAYVWDTNNTPPQNWRTVEVGSGYYKLVSQANNLVLDNPGSSTTAGTQMGLWSDNGGANQQWEFVVC